MKARGGKGIDGDSIAESLRSEIRSGRLPPGTPLREVALATRFGVSRTPVREALRRLLHERVLDRDARGLVVHEIDDDEVLQVYEIRIMLEEEVVAQASHARRHADISDLRGLLARDRSLDQPSDATRVTTNLEFHAALWSAAHNPVLEDLLRRLNTHLVQTARSTLATDERWAEALSEHEAMVDAIEARDTDAARRIARSHMVRARDIRRGLLREAAAARVMTDDSDR